MFTKRLISFLIIFAFPLTSQAGLAHLKNGSWYFNSELLCKQCKEVPKDPIQLECQSHKQPIFCHDCIQDHFMKAGTDKNMTATCPLCSGKKQYAAKNIEHMLAGERVSCKACDDTETYSEHKNCTLITKTVPEPSSDYIKRILAFSKTGHAETILPLLKKPPTWQSAYHQLHQYLTDESWYKNKRKILAHGFFSHKHNPLTQLPVSETTEGCYRVINTIYEQHHEKHPDIPLIIAAVGAGNCVIERTLYEYLQAREGRDSQSHAEEEPVTKIPSDSHNITPIRSGLFMHCSDLYPDGDNNRFRQGEPLMPCSTQMDYKNVATFLLDKIPNAKILFFQSWMPSSFNRKDEDNWVPYLLAHPATIGFIHVGNTQSCGLGENYYLLAKNTHLKKKGHVFAPNVQDGNHFKTDEYNLLGWCYEDSVTGDSYLTKNQLTLQTKLTVFHLVQFSLDDLKMDDLAYDDTFLKARFRHFRKRTNSQN